MSETCVCPLGFEKRVVVLEERSFRYCSICIPHDSFAKTLAPHNWNTHSFPRSFEGLTSLTDNAV